MSTKNHSGDKRGRFVPLDDIAGAVELPNGRALTPAAPQALHHFTRLDQIDQLVEASEADSDLGFMARLLALCSLPRTNPGDQKEYIRRNGPYTLGMSAGINNKLPYGNLPRLLLAWVCTEAVRTQNRELILGRSLADFMRSVVSASDVGVEVTATVTVAGVTGEVRPSTLCPARFDWATWVRTAATALSVPAMVPPLSAIAFAAQEIPFVSRSPLDPPLTAWENRSVVVPEPA